MFCPKREDGVILEAGGGDLNVEEDLQSTIPTCIINAHLPNFQSSYQGIQKLQGTGHVSFSSNLNAVFSQLIIILNFRILHYHWHDPFQMFSNSVACLATAMQDTLYT